jgi:hypothetical protein
MCLLALPCLSVYMELKLLNIFSGNLILGSLQKFFDTFWLKSDNNNEHFTGRLHVFLCTDVVLIPHGVIPSQTGTRYPSHTTMWWIPCDDIITQLGIRRPAHAHCPETTLMSLAPFTNLEVHVMTDRTASHHSYTTYKRAFANWKSRGNNRVNVPELIIYIYASCCVFQLIIFTIFPVYTTYIIIMNVKC